jgi:AcrR family transcriptional regulator
VNTRGEQTRANLLDAAERLFGERGVAGVSMREIRIASGARNTGALQFHFGDRDGLLDALTLRHLPRIAALQGRIHDEVAAAGELDDSRRLVEILVRPAAEYVNLGPSERNWVKIMGDVGTAPDMRLATMRQFAPEAAEAAGRELYARVEARVGQARARERMLLAAQIVVHVCADRARRLDDPRYANRVTDHEVFVENLVDMVHAGLFAPIGRLARRRRLGTGGAVDVTGVPDGDAAPTEPVAP